MTGSDIYAVGYSLNSSWLYVPGYWKNGSWTRLTQPDPLKDALADSIVVIP